MFKKKACLALVIVLCCCAGLCAQQDAADSLRLVLQRLENDTTKVNTLLELGSQIFRSQPDEAIIYSREAVELSEKLQFPKGQAYALKNTGLAYYIKGNYAETLNYWEQSLAVFQAIGDQLGVSNLLNNLGAVYFNQGDDPKALEYYLESLRVSEELGNQLRIATALTNIGAVYFNNPVNHDKARRYYLRALAISEAIGDPAAIGTSIVNLGETYIAKQDLDSALYFFEKALAAYQDSGASLAYILNNMAKVHALRGDFGEAIKLQSRAYREAEKVDGRLEMTQSLIGLGNSHQALERMNRDAEGAAKALTYYQQAFDEAQAGGWKPEMQKAAQGLYELYKQQQNYPLALRYHEIYASVKDTLLNEENINLLALLGAEYEYEQEKQQLQYELDAKIRRQQSIQFATAAGLVVALILIAIIIQYFRLLRMRAAEKFESQRQLIMQDKLASLGQITAGIAHEIKNPLNFVTNFAEGSVEFGQELLDALTDNRENLPPDQYDLLKELASDLGNNAKIIRDNGLRADRVVKRMMEQARGDKGEAQHVDLNTLIDENVLLAYHGYRAGAPGFDLEIERHYDPDLPPVPVIPQDIGRVILNIFHNACHALHEKQKQTEGPFSPTVWLVTERRDGKVLIRIRDNGTGIPEKIRQKIFRPFFTTKPTGEGNTGLGLAISYDLIVIGHHGELKVESQPGQYTEFLIYLPLERPATLTPVAA